MNENSPLGIFDSGIGGLTVVREITELMPNEDIIYFGDTARVPYGNKSKDTIIKYSFEIADFLVARGAKMLVVACNTASSLALGELKEKFAVPVIGVIDSAAREAALLTRKKRIGVIGTEATIESSAYTKVIKDYAPGLTVYSSACPLFVALVEEGMLDGRITELVCREYLGGMKKDDVDILILGCTHYPLLKDSIGKIMGSGVSLLDSAYYTARSVKKTLLDLRLTSPEDKKGSLSFYVSDSPARFIRIGEKFLGRKLDSVMRVE